VSGTMLLHKVSLTITVKYLEKEEAGRQTAEPTDPGCGVHKCTITCCMTCFSITLCSNISHFVRVTSSVCFIDSKAVPPFAKILQLLPSRPE
jgi:hypothetical protein